MRGTTAMPSTIAQTYDRARQGLHWLGALTILAMFPLGYVMARTADDVLRATLYRAHIVLGVTVLLLTVVRLVLAWRRPVPPPAGLPRWNAVLHVTVHRLALIVPLVLALTGMGTIVQNDLLPALQPGGTLAVPSVLEDARAQAGHRVLAWTYLGILAVHVAGVVRYQLTKGDVMGRMGVRGLAGKAG